MTRFGIEILARRVREAVGEEGMRPFARRAGVGIGVVRSILDGRDLSYSNAEALAKSLNLDFGFGPIAPPIAIDAAPESTFAHIPLHDALLAAGPGCCNSDEQVIDHLAFKRDWLKRLGVPATNARLARVQGDSMQPTMWPGDMILIDTRRNNPEIRPKDARDQRRSSIYALIDNGEARVKRIERPSDDLMMLISDNPDYAPELRQGKDIQAIQIIGKVVWWGHTAKE